MTTSVQQVAAAAAANFWRAIAAGVIAGILTAAIMALALKSGLSPFPKPLGLAFAQWLIGRPVPLPVGLLFHLAYVTGWSTLFILLLPRWVRFWPIFGFALALWLIAIFVFTPLVGWGVAATAVAGPKGVVATLIPHLLFGLFLWGSARLLFKHGLH